MTKKSSSGKKPRVPLQAGGIQVNFCKQPSCENFGRPAATTSQSRGRRVKTETRDSYKKFSSGRGVPHLQCLRCGKSLPIKSNQGIREELERISQYLLPPAETSCPRSECPNHGIPVSTGNGAYASFGKTKSGSRRFRCNQCYKTFSLKSTSTTRQKLPHKNRLVFELLMNRVPFRRILQIADISAPTLYSKIDFIHQQCLAFVREREVKLLGGLPIRRLYISSDRQDYMVNWADRNERRNIQFTALASVENETRYVFGHHINYDTSLDYAVVEREVEEIGDYNEKLPFRKFARLWLADDFYRSNQAISAQMKHRSVLSSVNDRYREYSLREDIELQELDPYSRKLPETGVMTRNEYTAYAHYYLLKRFFSGVEKIRFYIDQDSGIRAACLSAFKDEILDRRCDAFYVHYLKYLTVDEARHRMNEKKKQFREVQRQYPALSEYEIKKLMMRSQIRQSRSMGQFEDAWFVHPLPTMGEPEKAVSHMTNMGDYSEDHLAGLCLKATLQGCDSYFNQLRRRLSPIERPLPSHRDANKLWSGYHPYRPETILKLIEIHRVYHNFVNVGQDGKTPAMRLGLAKGPNKSEDIIYFQSIVSGH